MLGKLALPAIRELIEAGDDDTLHEVVNRWLPADLAELVDALATPEQVRVLRLLKPGRAAETFAYLDLDTQLSVLETLSEVESASILNEMAPDDRTALLAELPAERPSV
jgi:magnesium transporter